MRKKKRWAGWPKRGVPSDSNSRPPALALPPASDKAKSSTSTHVRARVADRHLP